MKWKHSETEREEAEKVGERDGMCSWHSGCRQWRETAETGRKRRGREGRKIGRGREGEVFICTLGVEGNK